MYYAKQHFLLVENSRKNWNKAVSIWIKTLFLFSLRNACKKMKKSCKGRAKFNFLSTLNQNVYEKYAVNDANPTMYIL